MAIILVILSIISISFNPQLAEVIGYLANIVWIIPTGALVIIILLRYFPCDEK